MGTSRLRRSSTSPRRRPKTGSCVKATSVSSIQPASVLKHSPRCLQRAVPQPRSYRAARMLGESGARSATATSRLTQRGPYDQPLPCRDELLQHTGHTSPARPSPPLALSASQVRRHSRILLRRGGISLRHRRAPELRRRRQARQEIDSSPDDCPIDFTWKKAKKEAAHRHYIPRFADFGARLGGVPNRLANLPEATPTAAHPRHNARKPHISTPHIPS